ncbi:hypothetical protein AB990_01635 [Alkalihalobacillus pseudalcaliphilus]|nr:hypothetical protein AB990_01635 [Alkalihalobacillus pseudalcaliphilus]
MLAEKGGGSPSKRGITGLRHGKEGGSLRKRGITGLPHGKERGSPSKRGITGLRHKKEGESPSKSKYIIITSEVIGSNTTQTHGEARFTSPPTKRKVEYCL